MDPILIDGCLSPKLASVARERGLIAFHALWSAWKGPTIGTWLLSRLSATT